MPTLFELLARVLREMPQGTHPAAMHKQTGQPRRRYVVDPDTSPPDAICFCTHRRDQHCGCGSACMEACGCDGFVRTGAA